MKISNSVIFGYLGKVAQSGDQSHLLERARRLGLLTEPTYDCLAHVTAEGASYLERRRASLRRIFAATSEHLTEELTLDEAIDRLGRSTKSGRAVRFLYDAGGVEEEAVTAFYDDQDRSRIQERDSRAMLRGGSGPKRRTAHGTFKSIKRNPNY